MEIEPLLLKMEQGRIEYSDKTVDVSSLIWNPHAKFAGVSLKHLVTGLETQGKFSSHIVRIKAGHEIGEHIHEGQWELHEVIYGSGKCIILDKKISYQPGIAAVIPAGIKHKVIANESDLYLLAKFVPAL